VVVFIEIVGEMLTWTAKGEKMSNGWSKRGEQWTKAAKKGPYTLLFKVLGTLIVVGLIFGAYGMICGGAREAAQVAKEEFGPRAMLKGKVTSSGKRLSPYSVAAGAGGGGAANLDHYGIPVSVGGRKYRTTEVLQDDGTYGSSMPYLYWWDTNGVYRQAYVSGVYCRS
jgi:hypothetical protein